MAETGDDLPPANGPVLECPRCGRRMRYSSTNPFRPFCSERCRLIDLGAWAREEYRIPESSPRDGGIAQERDDD